MVEVMKEKRDRERLKTLGLLIEFRKKKCFKPKRINSNYIFKKLN